MLPEALDSMSRSTINSVLIACALLLGIAAGGPAHAVLVQDLYSVELPVADQTTSIRLTAFNEAFREVVVKVSGSQQALELPGFKRPLNNSSRYVLQFRYLVRKEGGEEAYDSGQLYLRVTFNQELVEKLLRENGVAVWGKERPSTLLLISYDVNRKSTLMSAETTPKLVEEIDRRAARQGLPILFPLLDLEDRVTLGVRDVINRNYANIDQLAARYTPDAILTGKVVGRVGKGWQGEWQIRFSDQLFDWSFQSSSREEVFTQAVTELARILASEYALQSYQAFDQEILFTVDEVLSLADHIRVLAYLESLDAVESARLVLIDQIKATYRIRLRNTAEDLHRLIALGYVLEQLDLPQINAASDDPTVLMNYRLIH